MKYDDIQYNTYHIQLYLSEIKNYIISKVIIIQTWFNINFYRPKIIDNKLQFKQKLLK